MFDLTKIELRDMTFLNKAGGTISAIYSTYREVEPHSIVVVSPGYGKKKRSFGVVSAYLAGRGYATLRFDLTNHIGDSDGEIANLTMGSIAGDIEAAMEIAADLLPGRPIFLVAASLSGRAAIRVAAKRSIAGSVLLLPVMELKSTLARVVGNRDPIGEWLDGSTREINDGGMVAGHYVKFGFAKEACESHWHGMERTKTEMGAIQAPVTIIACAEDDWVALADVETVMSEQIASQSYPRNVVVIEASSHDISSNPPVARAMIEKIIEALDQAGGLPYREVDHLSFGTIVELRNLEYARSAN